MLGGKFADDGRYDRPGIIVGLLDLTHFVAVAQNVRKPFAGILTEQMGMECEIYEQEADEYPWDPRGRVMGMYFHKVIVCVIRL